MKLAPIVRVVSSLILSIGAVLFVGCMVQPKDAITGESVGGPVSVPGAAIPTQNPATGNPVVVVPTKDVDYARVGELAATAASAAASKSGIPSPWGDVLGAAVTAGFYELARSREKKALHTPAPGSPPPAPPTPPAPAP